jgi:hypothetical protein
VCPSAELHILSSKRGDLTVAQAGLDGEEEDCPIPSTKPPDGVRSCYERRGLFLRQKLNRIALVTLGGDRKDALAVQRISRFMNGHIPEECVQRGETVVSRTDAITPVEFEVVKEIAHEGRVDFLHAQIGRCLLEALRGETEQQTEGVTVVGNRVRTCAELFEQAVREESLEET